MRESGGVRGEGWWAIARSAWCFGRLCAGDRKWALYRPCIRQAANSVPPALPLFPTGRRARQGRDVLAMTGSRPAGWSGTGTLPEWRSAKRTDPATPAASSHKILHSRSNEGNWSTAPSDLTVAGPARTESSCQADGCASVRAPAGLRSLCADRFRGPLPCRLGAYLAPGFHLYPPDAYLTAGTHRFP